ncbi:hypothetical protein JWJ90_02580 [Desulfobulbus rhabdoformis]|jgi:hypothetical protein|uniref:hypothetical protein n=1 Tax=Desulfobulbus rhabdoformis TaxID=34032 RepID=UPI001964D00C|nr:hypothetical protein [Desulfobulbus rhabdoformis]MBM9613167.1 hypothetical protein [Desulfobulbus rhabdoformis]
MIAHLKGFLVEYATSKPPLMLSFRFNPQNLTRNRSVTLNLGSTPATRGGYDFALPSETSRVAQGVTVEPESFDLEILVDATDRMNISDPIAQTIGIQPELDTLRSMVEPKIQGPDGVQTLAGLGFGGDRAFQHNQSASVLLLVWGIQVLPVFLKSIEVAESAHLPNLTPYRATVKLSLQVIEGNNPFYAVEKRRQDIGSKLNSHQTVLGGILGGLI